MAKSIYTSRHFDIGPSASTEIRRRITHEGKKLEFTLPNKIYYQSTMQITVREFPGTRGRCDDMPKKTKTPGAKQSDDVRPFLRYHRKAHRLRSEVVHLNGASKKEPKKAAAIAPRRPVNSLLIWKNRRRKREN